MTTRHWSEDDFLDRLYEIGPEWAGAQSHMGECEDCRQRWLAFVETKRNVADSGYVPPELLSRQRQQILARVNGPAWRTAAGLRWATALAGVAALGTGLVVWMPQTRPTTPKSNSTISDQQLFSDVAAMTESSEPQAVKPIRNLFEDQQ